MIYTSSKTFGNDRGLSCCFRQWKAESHCSLLHGYSMGFKLVFESSSLDNRNWVYDFGAFKGFKGWLEQTFDHTVLIAKDDPYLSDFRELASIYQPSKVKSSFQLMENTEPHERGALMKLVVVDAVGCEAFAKLAYDTMESILLSMQEAGLCNPAVKLKSVEAFEHGSNSATYYGD